MNTLHRIIIGVCALIVSMASSAPARAEDRTLQHTGVLNAPVAEVWKGLSTPEGWVGAMGVAHAEIDFKVGGAIRTIYDPAKKVGDPGTIVNTILAYEPERMLAIKPTAPEGAPDFIKAICETGWSVIRLEPLAPDRTRLTITGMGYKEGEVYDKAYAFFDMGNETTLRRMQKHFAKEDQPAQVDRAESLMRSMAGSWEFSVKREDGSAFRGETSISQMLGDKFFLGVGSLGDDKALTPHSHLVAGRDPESGAMKVWNFADSGDVTVGAMYAEGTSKLVIDWNTYSAGSPKRLDYRVEFTDITADSYNFQLWLPPDPKTGERKKGVGVTYKRVQPVQRTTTK